MANKRHPGRPKTRITWDPCKVEGCENTTERSAFGMCRKHYMQVRRGMRAEDGTLLRPAQRVRSYGEGARCSVPDCSARPKAQGMCAKHWQAANYAVGDVSPKYAEESRQLGHCRLCDSEVVYRTTGLCGKHHKQLAAGAIDIEGNRLRSPKKVAVSYRMTVCLVPGCTERPVNRHMCRAHYKQRDAGIIDEHGVQLREKKAWKRVRTRPWVGQDGYVLVQAPDGHPNARQDGSILQHRLVMSQALGRGLLDHEIVHHKNGNRSDNSLENLELLDGRAQRQVGLPGHAPGHAVDEAVAVQVLLQDPSVSGELRQLLLVRRGVVAQDERRA